MFLIKGKQADILKNMSLPYIIILEKKLFIYQCFINQNVLNKTECF